MNLGTLKTHLANAVGNDAVSAHIGRLANQVQYDILSRYPFSFRESLPVQITCTPNQNYVDPSTLTNFGEPLDAIELTTPKKLAYVPNWNVFLADPNYAKDPTSVKGVPKIYSIDWPNQRLWLYPTPNAAHIISVRYLKLFTEVSADSDTFLIPAQWHHVLCDGIESRLWQMDEDLKSAQAANQRYEAGIAQMIEREQQAPEQQPIITAGERIVDYSDPFIDL